MSIYEYQSKVKEAIDLFERYKGLEQPKHPLEWQASGISQLGYLDPEGKIFYFLHGYGCCVNLQSGRVDWDFGSEGQIDGFDLFRLHEFVNKGTQDFTEFRDEAILKAIFTEAELKGLIYKSDDILYYLANVG
ncbi:MULTISPECIES: DUF6896 domain-containing protein [unclassified Chamaesiphon]|uniref:DUF6896 domain-containing protein n=1 Tax=unclassified Chamaesiphon TaxID=2620921 RepID=UPI00286BFBF5|nr:MULTISPECIES: hypothetical protein [unclassified Chamaesiphon]